ncbi:MAG: hypothetical protein H8E32_03355 [Nitrospinae bacterium]|nr:hypothetical protein [Nitrospinota bacterium]
MNTRTGDIIALLANYHRFACKLSPAVINKPHYGYITVHLSRDQNAASDRI